MKRNAIDKVVLNTSSVHFVNHDSVRFVFNNIVNGFIYKYMSERVYLQKYNRNQFMYNHYCRNAILDSK